MSIKWSLIEACVRVHHYFVGLVFYWPIFARAEVFRPTLLHRYPHHTSWFASSPRCSIIIYLIQQSPAYHVLDIYIFHNMCDACLEDNFSKGYIICPSYYIRPTLCNAVILLMPTDDWRRRWLLLLCSKSSSIVFRVLLLLPATQPRLLLHSLSHSVTPSQYELSARYKN